MYTCGIICTHMPQEVHGALISVLRRKYARESPVQNVVKTDRIVA